MGCYEKDCCKKKLPEKIIHDGKPFPGEGEMFN